MLKQFKLRKNSFCCHTWSRRECSKLEWIGMRLNILRCGVGKKVFISRLGRWWQLEIQSHEISAAYRRHPRRDCKFIHKNTYAHTKDVKKNYFFHFSQPPEYRHANLYDSVRAIVKVIKPANVKWTRKNLMIFEIDPVKPIYLIDLTYRFNLLVSAYVIYLINLCITIPGSQLEVEGFWKVFVQIHWLM